MLALKWSLEELTVGKPGGGTLKQCVCVLGSLVLGRGCLMELWSLLSPPQSSLGRATGRDEGLM